MALNAPKPVEIENIQFKLHSKHNIFAKNSSFLRSNVSLLATSSNFGLIFIGDPYKPELKAVQLKNSNDSTEDNVLARTIPLLAVPNQIASSCDGTMLAIQYTLNNSAFLSILNVKSVITENQVQFNYLNIRISVEDNVETSQLLWNPVIANTLAIILNNGGLSMYNFKDANNYELFSIDKSQRAKCGCWSPKGKQIVIGFPQGKLAQFKPDLKLAKTIECPAGVHDGPFDTIAIQWLSTYQFACSFLQHGDGMTSCLYIVNAPKAGPPSYINYYDICYSDSGPRKGQIFLLHIQQWNLLLVASANSMETGVLGTTEAGDCPTWYEFTIQDSCRLSLPMTKDKEETYPIGFILETGCEHQLIINENQIPVMPMIHVLSTHGQMVSYDFLNLISNAPGLCSPPQFSLNQISAGLFKPLELQQIKPVTPPAKVQIQNQPDSSFLSNFGAATSTPAAKSKPLPNFTSEQNLQTTFITGPAKPTLPSFTGVPGAAIQPFAGFGLHQTQPPGTVLSTIQPPTSVSFQSPQIPLEQKQKLFTGQVQPPAGYSDLSSNLQTKTINASKNATKSIQQPSGPIGDKSKPLYTVPPVFNPPTNEKPAEPTESRSNVSLNNASAHDFLTDIIKMEIQSFELELKELSSKSKDVDISIGNMEESKNCTKHLTELNDIQEQLEEIANFQTDLQILRHSVNESYAMIVEVRSKLEMFENPELSKLALMSGSDQTNRRQIIKLTSAIATTQAQLHIVQQQIDGNWSAYQDLVKQNSKSRLHVPSLEGIYQTMTKQKDIVSRERRKIANIKQKLNVKDLIIDKTLGPGISKKFDVNIDSLADSILSISLSDQVKKDKSYLTDVKLQAIRDVLKHRKIVTIKPHRPDRMKSEVILEYKIKDVSKQRAKAAAKKLEKKGIPKSIENNPNVKTQIQTNPIVKSSDVKSSVSNEEQEYFVISNAPSNLSLRSLNDEKINEIKNSQETVIQQFKPSLSFGDATKTISSQFLPPTSTGKNQKQSFSFTPVATAKTAIYSPPESGIILNTPPAFQGFNFSSKVTETDQIKVPVSSKPNEPIKPVFASLNMNPINTKPFTGFADINVKKPIPVATTEKSAFSATSATFAGLNFSSNSFGKTADETVSTNLSQNKIETPSNITTVPSFGGLFVAKTTSGEGTNTTDKKSLFTPLSASNAAPNIFSFGNSAFSSTMENKGITVNPEITATSIAPPNVPNKLTTASANNITQTQSPLSISSMSNIENVHPDNLNTKIVSGTNTDSLLSSLNICKPTPITQTKPLDSGNIFSGTNINFSFAGLGTLAAPTSIFKITPQSTAVSSASTTTAPSSTAATVIPITVGAALSNPLPLGTNSTLNTLMPKANVNPTVTTSSATSIATFSFTGLNKPESATHPVVSKISTITGPLSPINNIIPSVSESFKPSQTPSTQPSFGVIPITASQPTSTFAPVPVTTSTTSSFNSQNSTTTTLFNTTSPTTSVIPGIFSGIPKPDQSVFNTAPLATAFGNISTSTSPPFGANQPSGNIFSQPVSNNTGGSIFGGSNSANTAPIFGGTAAANQPNLFSSSAPAPAVTQASTSPFTNTGSIFASEPEKGNLFGTPSTPQQNIGPIFGQSAFSNTSPQNPDPVFGGGTSNFGVQSIFGGGSAATQQVASPFSGGTAQTSFGASNSFSGGGGISSGFTSFSSQAQQSAFASPTQTGFGSPNSSFVKPPNPAFGSPPAFGVSPTFGGAATFGGGPTFGGGGFNTFSTGPVNSPNITTPPPQKNNLFETLGSSGDGLTFGNLAQNTVQQQQQQKPTFGTGSQFSSWR